MNAIKTFNTEETWRWSGYGTAWQLEQEGDLNEMGFEG